MTPEEKDLAFASAFQPNLPQKPCGDCGLLSPFHAYDCKQLPPRQDVLDKLREKHHEMKFQIDEMKKWCCSACGLFVKNDPAFNRKFADRRVEPSQKCHVCGGAEHGPGGYCQFI
jgi:hypothetical protein